jgi:alkylated DNA repair dioxygenase AlkB
VQRIELEDGAYLEFAADWIAPDLARTLLDRLLSEVPWQARTIRVFGREVMQPRRVAWLGEPEAVYTYSGVRNEPRPFTPALLSLRERLERELALSFNAVLCNLYRDGRDSMGMHSDAEPELGSEPLVASLSFGATRTFRLRHRAGGARAKYDLPLPSGSLLMMSASTQRLYRHAIPKEARVTEPRINLTFRKVYPVRER